MKALRSRLLGILAWSTIALSGWTAVLVCLIRHQNENRSNRSGRLVVIGTFHNPNWFISHLSPLALSRVSEVIVITDEPLMAIDGVTYFCPPPKLSRILGRAPAKLIYASKAGFRFKPEMFMGYHIYPNAMIALIASRLFGATSCYQCGGGPVEIAGGGYQCENRVMSMLTGHSEFLESLLKRISREIDLVIVRGGTSHDYFSQFVLEDNVKVVPGSIAISPERPNSLRDIDLVFVGRLEPIKQPDQIIEALALMKQDGVRAVTWFIGEGELGTSLEALVSERGLSDQVSFLGKRSNVEDLLKRARIFILTSRSEGLSIALAEAMGAGVVPVVANVGDLRDLVRSGENGFLIEPGMIADYSTTIRAMLQNQELWEKMSQSAHSTVLGYSALPVISARWNSCFDQLSIFQTGHV